MELELAVKYVAAAYALILIVLFTYYILAARRLSSLQRQVDLLSAEVDKQDRPSGSDA